MTAASHQEKAEKKRDVAQINRQACQVKGTISIRMAMKATRNLSRLVSELVNCSPPSLKRKVEEMTGILSHLEECHVNAKKWFQAGGDLGASADHVASYQEANLNRCIKNGKDPISYKGIDNFTPDMIRVYTQLHFGEEKDMNSPATSPDVVTPTVSSVNDDAPSVVKNSNSDTSSCSEYAEETTEEKCGASFPN